MSRWIRWEFVVPRALAVVVAVLAVQYGLSHLVRALVVGAGEAAIGAKVDVGHARVALLDGLVELHDLRIANPRAPMQNLLQFNHGALDLETTSLLHRRMVIQSGRITGLEIATPRSTSGALPAPGEAPHSVAIHWLGEHTAELAEAWLDQLAEQFEKDVLDQLESVRLAEELLARWPQQYDALENRVAQLRARGAELNDTYAEAQTNPLRHIEFLKTLPQEIAVIQREFIGLTREIENLPDLVEADRQAIVAARKHDEQLIREQLRVDNVDAGLLTAYFLHDHLSAHLGELITWVGWIHAMTDDEPELIDAPRFRGEDILFDGVVRSPNLLVRSLELQGTTSIAGAPTDLRGTLENLSTAPGLQTAPTRLHLVATGGATWQLEATIDRTGPVSRDQIVINCQQLPLPGAIWGRAGKLQLAVAPSAAALNVRLLIEDEKISGKVQLVEHHLRLTPKVGDDMQAVPLASALEESIGIIDSLALGVTLSGTLDEPRCRLSSNFGTLAADAMASAVERATEQHTTQILHASQRHVDEQLAGLAGRIAERQTVLLSPLEGSRGVVEKIVRDRKSSTQLSTERIGRQLPAGSLFR